MKSSDQTWETHLVLLEYVLSDSHLSHLPANHREDAGCLCCVAKYTQLSLYSSWWYMLVPLGLRLDWTEDINNLSKILKGTRERNTPNKCLSNISLLNVLWKQCKFNLAHRSRHSYFFVFNKKLAQQFPG